MSRLTYCMMTWNRLYDTMKCIERVKPYVDRVVVVDGGSTDDTILTLRNYEGVELYLHPWEDNFPRQRNNYLKHAGEDNGGTDWCYDNKTEILTNEGFKKFSDLNKSEMVLTLDPQTKEMVYQKPSKYQKNKFCGKMITFNGKSTSFSVTPNHRMFVSPNANYNMPYKFMEAKDLTQNKKARFICSGKWEGNHPKSQIVNDIDNIVLMKLLGWYISEGWSYSQGFRNKIQISQTKKQYREEIISLISCINRSPILGSGRHSDTITFYHKPLFDFLQQFGKSAFEKKLTSQVKMLDKSLLSTFLEAYLKGDGSNQRTFTTISPILADDIQEICIKLGSRCCIKAVKPKPGGFNSRGNRIIGKHTRYNGSISDNSESIINTNEIEKTEYDGYTFCLTVPNSIVCVRRNGRVFFCGNCLVSDPDELFSVRALENMRAEIDKAGPYNMLAYESNSVSMKGPKVVNHRQDKYWKGLLFKWNPGIHYVGNPHETLVIQGGPRVKNLPYHYYHIKQDNMTWHRGYRNFHIGGGGPNLGTKNEYWNSYKQILIGIYGKYPTWHEFEPILVKGNIDSRIKDWMYIAKGITGFDGSSEVRESYKTYFRILHPEEEPEEFRGVSIE